MPTYLLVSMCQEMEQAEVKLDENSRFLCR